MTAGRDLNFVVVASTAGSVLNEALKNDFFRSKIHSVVVDRACVAIEKARSHGIRVQSFEGNDNDEFCNLLLEYLLRNEIDYVLSYYTRFYSKKLRAAFQDRIINFHPSLLPAFKGMDGFGDTVGYGARFVGNTVELIDQVMDEGKIIMQTACPLDLTVSLNIVRHRVFVQQCQALLQIVKWLTEDRVVVCGRKVTVKDATFESLDFSPALDFEDARRLSVQLPEPDLR